MFSWFSSSRSKSTASQNPPSASQANQQHNHNQGSSSFKSAPNTSTSNSSSSLVNCQTAMFHALLATVKSGGHTTLPADIRQLPQCRDLGSSTPKQP